MALTYPIRRLRLSFSFSLALLLTGVAVAQTKPPGAAAPAQAPAPRLRLKAAQAIRVTLGTRRHEPASGIRPEKGVWNVVPTTISLKGATAELVDLTPYAPRSRWVVQVQGDKLVLDADRFRPTHVYRLEVRKEKRVIGTALVYLYPPPAERVGKVEFNDEETSSKKDDSPGVARVPKGDL